MAGVVAGVQANLMATLMDTPHQGPNGGMLWFVLGIQPWIGAATDEIKGAVDTGGVALIHQPLKGVEGIGRMELAASGQADARSHESPSQVALLHQPGGHAAQQGALTTKSIGTGRIHVVTHDSAELGLLEGQAGPEALHDLAQYSKPLIDNRPLEVTMLNSVAAGCWKAAVIVEQLRRWIDLFTAGEHPVGQTKNVVGKLEAIRGGLHQRLGDLRQAWGL